MKNMGVTIYSWGGHCFHPLQSSSNSTEMEKKSRSMAQLHKASSVAALPFRVTQFRVGFAPIWAVKKTAGLPSPEWTSDNDYILTQEFLQAQERWETAWVSYVIFSVSPERFFEDHENVVEVLSDWTRDTENKILFLEKSQKYALFKNPQVS